MQPRSILLLISCLYILFAGCSKKKDAILKDVRGVVVYTSCAVTVVRIIDREMGVSWTNCHNENRYEHVFDVHIADSDEVLEVGQEIRFDIVEDEPSARCKMMDCAPSLTATIVLK